MPCCFCKLPPCDYGAPLGRDYAPGIGFLVRLRLAPRWVKDSGWGAARETRERLSLGEDEAPLNAPFPPPDGGGISSCQGTGAQQPEGSAPDR